MTSRRKFIQSTALAGAAVLTGLPRISTAKEKSSSLVRKPIVLSTWNHGMAANEGAWKVLSAKGKALDAVEKGVNVTEADFTNHSVGLGGLPDRDGKVTLDASIMNEKSSPSTRDPSRTAPRPECSTPSIVSRLAVRQARPFPCR